MTTSPFTGPTRSDSTNVGRSPRPIPRLFEATATAAVVFSGLFAGMLLAVAVLESSMRGLAAPVYTQVRLVELDRLGGLATILLLPAIIATAALAWSAIRRRAAGRWLTLTALLLLLTAFGISVAINVPINTAQQGWSVAAPPSDWSGVRDRWQLAHVARTSTAALAFVLLAAVTTSQRSRQGNATQAQPRKATTR
jgi:anthrone oxygenase-like protein